MQMWPSRLLVIVLHLSISYLRKENYLGCNCRTPHPTSHYTTPLQHPYHTPPPPDPK